MLNGLYIQNTWQQFHGMNDRVYVILERPRIRNTGGKYTQDKNMIEVYEIRAVQMIDKGNNEMKMSENGLYKMDKTMMIVPISELDRLGITKMQPDMKFFVRDSIVRVINYFIIKNAGSVRVKCEITRDPVPNFASLFDFESDESGEIPSGWTVVDPEDGLVMVQDLSDENKLVIINNPGGDAAPSATLCVLDHILGPATSISFKIALMGTTAPDSSKLLDIYGGESNNPDYMAFHLGIFVSAEKYYIRDIVTSSEVEITDYTDVEVEVYIDKLAGTVVVMIDGEELVTTGVDAPAVNFLVFTGSMDVDGTFAIDDVEVGCINDI